MTETTGGWRAVVLHDDTLEAISAKSSYHCRDIIFSVVLPYKVKQVLRKYDVST